MRLRAASAQSVRVSDLGLTVEFAAGEEMRTEVSAKFREAGVAAELAAAGLAMRSWWTDPERPVRPVAGGPRLAPGRPAGDAAGGRHGARDQQAALVRDNREGAAGRRDDSALR